MAEYIRVLEIEEDGRGIGKFRRTRSTDDPESPPHGLCEHAHDTREEAEQCPDARVWGDDFLREKPQADHAALIAECNKHAAHLRDLDLYDTHAAAAVLRKAADALEAARAARAAKA